MGSTTQYLKFPFPVSSDLIADGAVNMEQLADSVEDVMIVPSNSLAMNAPWNSYPVGASMMQVTNSSDWPSSGIVFSLRRQGGDQTHQYWSGTSVAKPQVQFRYGSSAGWSDWAMLGSLGAPDAMAAGGVLVTPKAGEAKAVTITFPSGRFVSESVGGKLRPQLTAGGATRPQDIALCVYSISPSAMTVYIYRTTATETSIGWQVTQGLDPTGTN